MDGKEIPGENWNGADHPDRTPFSIWTDSWIFSRHDSDGYNSATHGESSANHNVDLNDDGAIKLINISCGLFTSDRNNERQYYSGCGSTERGREPHSQSLTIRYFERPRPH
jgi:hypothetical protein